LLNINIHQKELIRKTDIVQLIDKYQINKVLICPLDWGLGHASRCIPIIQLIQKLGIQITIAASAQPYELLKSEFPDLRFIDFPAYSKISYSSYLPAWLKIAFQTPSFWAGYFFERKWISRQFAKEKFDLIISDNRYGVFHPSSLNILITHQLRIQLPNILSFTSLIFNKLIEKAVMHFHECWIPDNEGLINLSGKLSHCRSLPLNVKFIGAISRFKLPENEERLQSIDILVLLSGPEPQRSILEKLLFEILSKSKFNVHIIRGTTEQNYQMKMPENCTSENLTCSEPLERLILSSKLIIARSGYTTVMDLHLLNRKCILIPTPGQTEQEYLADYLKDKFNFYFVKQKFVRANLLRLIHEILEKN